MRIFEESPGDVRVLRLMGEVDTTDVPALAARLAARPGPARLVVNMKDVTFATGAAVGCLVEARAGLKRSGGDLVVSAASEPVVRLVQTLGLGGVLPHFADDAAAVRHVRAGVVRGETAHVPYAAAS